MKLTSYTLAKKDFLLKLQNKASQQQTEISSATEFVKEIEKGNLDVKYNNQTEIDENFNELAASLISMRNQMKKFSEEEKERNWVTEGLAKFVDILRSKNENFNELADNIISNLVRYMKANQGALYLINDDNIKDVHIEMIACYAYNRKKHLNQRIEMGQGLTGQVVMEKDVLYLTDIPNNYLKITSGLGEALPRNLLMVPLKLDEKIYGVVEIASFDKIRPYQISFVQKLGESIAATISSVKINERTKKLLVETQQQAEQMRSQEEEMRQNMEELSATQEEMQRILKEVQGQEAYMNELINSSSDSILVVDREYKVLSANRALQKSYEGSGFEVVKGFDAFKLFSDTEKSKYKSYYDRALGGEEFQLTEHYQSHGFDSYFLIQYTPIRKASGEVTAAAVFAKDITEMVKAQKKADTLVHESQQRNEELKAQEEELRQNMEELSATQDEMQRVLQEVQRNEQDITELINVSGDSILTMDRDFKVLRFNKVFSSTFEAKGLTVGKGFEILNIFNDEEKKKKIGIYNRVFAGERLEIVDHLDTGGFDNYFSVTHAPIKDANGEITSIAVFAKDITEMYNARKKAEELALESQQRNEELKAQEEELRQNMEELSATQEEMRRILLEVQAKEGYLNEVINAAKDSIFTLDKDFKVISANKAFTSALETLGMKVDKGFDMLSIFQQDKEEQNKQRSYYKRALAGETFEVTDHSELNGIESYYNVNYSPLKKEDGTVFAIAVFAKDVTEIMKAKELTEKLLSESKNQEHYFNDVINGLGDSVLTIDRDFKIVIANSTFKKVFSSYGVSTEPGNSLLSMAKKGDIEEFKKPYLKAFKGEVVEVPHRHHFDRDFHVFYNPLKDSSGKVIGVALIAHDITKRLEMQRKTEELLKESQAVRKSEKERADSQINAQKKILDQATETFKRKEEEYKQRIAALEKAEKKLNRSMA